MGGIIDIIEVLINTFQRAQNKRSVSTDCIMPWLLKNRVSWAWTVCLKTCFDFLGLLHNAMNVFSEVSATVVFTGTYSQANGHRIAVWGSLSEPMCHCARPDAEVTETVAKWQGQEDVPPAPVS